MDTFRLDGEHSGARRQTSQAREFEEVFVQCPEMFLEGLSPEKYRARQQLYQTAFQNARLRVEHERKRFIPPFEFETSAGI